MSTTEQKALTGSLVEAAQEYTIRNARIAELLREVDALRAQAEALTKPKLLTRLAKTIAQEARGYVREITTAWDRDNLHDRIDRLAEMASRQAQTPALTRPAVPNVMSQVVNDACWEFVEAMPHQLPGPIFNDLKPALYAAIKLYHEKWIAAAPQSEVQALPFQARVQPWLMECFGAMIAGDREERNHRFLEESLELVQALGCTANEAHQLVDYTFGRPIGEPVQEVGGVMVTLAALCLANGLNMHSNGETELARISAPEMVMKIRAKQAAKPKYSPLPEAQPANTTAENWLRTKYGAYRGHPEWRALEVAFNAGMTAAQKGGA